MLCAVARPRAISHEGARGAAQAREAITEMSAGKHGQASALVPQGWSAFTGLRCGFGDRAIRAPAGSITARQVHGARIVEADDLSPGHHDETEADGLTITRSSRTVAVATADCVPILLVEPQRRWAAAVHAGWRGTITGIALDAVRAARDAGCNVERLHAALGPSIGPCCYEVGEDVAGPFADAGFEVVENSGKPRLDLRAVNRRLLIQAGVPPRAIVSCGPCTCCRNRRYWSYRVDRERCGRQLSWIGWEGRCAGMGR